MNIFGHRIYCFVTIVLASPNCPPCVSGNVLAYPNWHLASMATADCCSKCVRTSYFSSTLPVKVIEEGKQWNIVKKSWGVPPSKHFWNCFLLSFIGHLTSRDMYNHCCQLISLLVSLLVSILVSLLVSLTVILSVTRFSQEWSIRISQNFVRWLEKLWPQNLSKGFFKYGFVLEI